MAAADVGDVSALLDVASTSAPSASPAPAAEPSIDTAHSEAAVPETPETGEGAPTETPEVEGGERPAADDKVDARTNPDAIRKALRTLRDSSPENAPIARRLNDIVGRESAYKAVFPKVADAKQAKFLLDSIGGGDGLTQLQATIKSVNETDSLLYAGDGKVLDSILEDMRAAGKPDAFGKLASPFLERLAEHDPKAYAAALRPHFFQSITQSGLPDMLAGFDEALNAKDADGKPAPNIELIKALATEMKRWYNAEKSAVDGFKKSALDPDRQAFEKERSEFDTQRKQAFQNDVNSDWNRVNNQSLGEALKPYLKLPFAKSWTDKTKASVAQEIIRTALSDMTADKTYQSAMDGFWSQSKPDKSRIIQHHKGWMDLNAQRIVREVLEARYPGFSSVRGAPAAAPKPGAPKPPVATANGAAPAKPVFQSTKPRYEDVDWDRTNDNLYATGKYYKKGEKGNVLRTWNPKYK